MLSDDELLDFDARRLADFSPSRAKRQLAEHGDVFRAQLVAARWIEGWRQRMEERPIDHVMSRDWQEGHAVALREVVAHLRQGDLLPGGVLYDEEVAGVLPHPGEPARS